MRSLNIEGPAGHVARVGVADNYFLRLRGLIGRRLEADGGLLIKPCRQIHTCFMSGPIDAVYLDRDQQVLQVDQAIAPGRFRPAVAGGYYVLELSPGQAGRCQIRVGDRLRW